MSTRQNHKWVTLAVLCLSVFLVVVDNTIVNVALPVLSQRLHASNSALQWIVDGYSLPFAALLLAGGGLSDRLGRKRVMQVGLFFFALFSAGAAFSHTTGELLTSRALMGVAAAFVFPATLSILTTTFTDSRERAKAFGIWGATSGLAVAFGPITGGALITHYWWGSVFLVNLPLVAVTLLAGHLLIAESKSPFTRRLDFGGLLLGSVGIAVLVLAIIEGPTWGWRATRTLALFAVSLVLLVVFTVYEARREGPLLDVRVFKKPAFSGGALAIAASFFTLFGFIFVLTQYFQLVRGYSALSSGVHTLPFAIASVVVTPLGALLALKIGARWVVGTGLFIMAGGVLWVGLQTATDSYWGPIIGSMLVMATGFSLITAPSTAALMGSLDPEQIGAGSAINNVTRELGGTLGVAVVGSAFSSVFGPQVLRALGSVSATTHLSANFLHAHGADSSMSAALGWLGKYPRDVVGAVHPRVVDAFMQGMHRGCFVAAGVAVILGLVAYATLPATVEHNTTGLALH